MKILKETSRYLIAPALTLLAFAFLFQLWKADFSQPFFSYSNDALLSSFSIKGIIDNGWYFKNDFVGWPHFRETFFSHDFPAHADFFNFVVIKIFSYFSSNPFLILNCFFIFSLASVAFVSFLVLKNFKISDFTATAISVLYALTHYHFARSVNHLFLSNYAIVPLLIMVSLWIMSDKIKFISSDKEGCLTLRANRFFYLSLLISILAAASGIYYAVYGCIIFVFAYFLRSIEIGNFLRRDLYFVMLFCCVIFLVLLLLNLPTLNYWIHNGWNSATSSRSAFDSEFFALKIVNLFLPVENHYIPYFANITRAFNVMAREMESTSESLGLIGSVGFLFLLLWLIARAFVEQEDSFLNRFIQKFHLTKDDQNLIARLSSLNFLIVIFATVGGLVMLMSLSFPLLRSHARFSIFIAFLSLFLIAIIFDKIIDKKIFNKNNFVKIAVVFVTIIALFDQVGRVGIEDIQSQKMKNSFVSDKNFVEKIEKNLPQGAMIFAMPIITFPEGSSYGLMTGYLHSKKLNWSYPTMKNRDTAIWQQLVAHFDSKSLVGELRRVGFKGIYLDRSLVMSEHNWKDLKRLEIYLKSISKEPPVVSSDFKLVFFKI